MTVRDALNRGYNLVGTAIIAISGLAFFPEFFTEDEPAHKLYEGLTLLSGRACLQRAHPCTQSRWEAVDGSLLRC
jgi:hypothetical protein